MIEHYLLTMKPTYVRTLARYYSIWSSRRPEH